MDFSVVQLFLTLLHLTHIFMHSLIGLMEEVTKVAYIPCQRHFLFLAWSRVHDVHRKTSLSPKHQIEGGITSCGLFAEVVGHAHFMDMVLPFKGVVLDTSGQYLNKCPIESFYYPVGLGMVRCCPSFVDVEELAEVGQDFRFKLPPLIRVKLLNK